MPEEDLRKLLKDPAFAEHVDRVDQTIREYMEAPTWFSLRGDRNKDDQIAYFSAEFGIHESLEIYCGGLGILAGDHLKSASDLGLPLVGVGLMYKEGYFRQSFDESGWQQEEYRHKDFSRLPFILQTENDGSPIEISIDLPGRKVYAQIWRLYIGRISLYLLDTDYHRNSDEDKNITFHLYGGGTDLRIQQEILLGVGGLRALNALGIQPSVFHMNEGHSAFLSLERIRQIMEDQGLSYKEAKEITRASSIFTTHTPVPAGNDWFPADKIEWYLRSYYEPLGLSTEEFLRIGRENPEDHGQLFCMTVLALHHAHYANGVSKLHGEVSRNMWKNLWPEKVATEVPIDSITNGIHLKSWIAREMKELFDKYIGADWKECSDQEMAWEKTNNIPDEELWGVHQTLKKKLILFVRGRLRQRLQGQGASDAEMKDVSQVLDPDVLTIGFARRFATYKRATMILQDIERLDRILNHSEKPVQIVFSGKAHPKDDAGKKFIQGIIQTAKEKRFKHRLVFLENYDIEVARFLVHGVDVWLNNPKKPLEASGTSGMKVVPNGGLNFSILDGWWAEGYAPGNGWAIKSAEEHEDDAERERQESLSLYDILENEIVPLYYEKDATGLSRGWVAMMKQSIRTLSPQFSTYRMVQDYYLRGYLPSLSTV